MAADQLIDSLLGDPVQRRRAWARDRASRGSRFRYVGERPLDFCGAADAVMTACRRGIAARLQVDALGGLTTSSQGSKRSGLSAGELCASPLSDHSSSLVG